MIQNDWFWARTQMRKARDKSKGKPLRGNKSVYLTVSPTSPTDDWESDECIYGLQHWHTETVRYFPNGSVGASLQGWNTITTKQRIVKFSPLRLSSHRNVIFGSAKSGEWWPGDEYTWFYAYPDRGGASPILCLADGTPVPRTASVRPARPIPKRRDTLSNPKDGDAFRDSKGRAWVCGPVPHPVYGWQQEILALWRYRGDHPASRHHVVVGPDMEFRDIPRDLELLADVAARGLRPIERFPWPGKVG